MNKKEESLIRALATGVLQKTAMLHRKIKIMSHAGKTPQNDKKGMLLEADGAASISDADLKNITASLVL